MTDTKTAIKVLPGETVPDSGIYEDIASGRRATLVKGEHAPPTPETEGLWRQVIDTNPDDSGFPAHLSGRDGWDCLKSDV